MKIGTFRTVGLLIFKNVTMLCKKPGCQKIRIDAEKCIENFIYFWDVKSHPKGYLLLHNEVIINFIELRAVMYRVVEIFTVSFVSLSLVFKSSNLEDAKNAQHPS